MWQPRCLGRTSPRPTQAGPNHLILPTLSYSDFYQLWAKSQLISLWHSLATMNGFFSGGSDGKESACNMGDQGSIPELGRSPGEGNGNPLQHSGLENSMDCLVHGVTKSRLGTSCHAFLRLFAIPPSKGPGYLAPVLEGGHGRSRLESNCSLHQLPWQFSQHPPDRKSVV